MAAMQTRKFSTHWILLAILVGLSACLATTKPTQAGPKEGKASKEEAETIPVDSKAAQPTQAGPKKDKAPKKEAETIPVDAKAAKSANGRVPCTIERVVDGDTMKVKLSGGHVDTLRLLSVDTEESFTSSSKPATNFGRATSEWAKQNMHAGEPCELEYGPEKRGIWGRLLVYLWYEGENFNLRMVREGYSPYFSKYGYSAAHHEAFKKAEALARTGQKGIWDPSQKGNLRGEYKELKAWWNRRAEALKNFDEAVSRRGDIYFPRRGDYSLLLKRMDKPVTIFTAVRTAKESGRYFVGKSEGKLSEPLEISAVLTQPKVVETLRGAVGEYRYFHGKLIRGNNGKPRLVIETVNGISVPPPPRS